MSSIGYTILFFASFFLAFTEFLLIPKSEKRLNLISWCVISFSAILCLGVLITGIIALFQIPIQILTVSLIYIAIDIVFFLILNKSGRRQQYSVYIYDIICIVIFAVLVTALCITMYTVDLQLGFQNSDAAVHFGNAMKIVRTQSISGMYLASLYLAMVIEALSPFFKVVNYYQIFILVDAFSLFLELAMFFVIIRDFIKTRFARIIGLILCLLYFGGYPLMCYVFNFYYWGLGVLYIALTMLMLRYYSGKEIDRRWCILLLMLANVGVFLSYMLFAPVSYLAALITLIFIMHREKERLFCMKNVKICLFTFLIPCAIGFYYAYYQWFVQGSTSAASALATQGGMYKELYINFLWFLPAVLFWFYSKIHDRVLDENVIFFICFALCILGMFVLTCRGYMSTYYFYKMYYPIWMICYIILLLAFTELFEKHRAVFLSYITVVGLLAGLSVTNGELYIMDHTEDLTSGNYSRQYFEIYYFNKGYLNSNVFYNNEILDLCEYVIDNLSEEPGGVALIADMAEYGYTYYFDSITGMDSSDYHGWEHSLEELQELIATGDTRYFILLKEENSLYITYPEYWNSFACIYENSLGVILYTGD